MPGTVPFWLQAWMQLKIFPILFRCFLLLTIPAVIDTEFCINAPYRLTSAIRRSFHENIPHFHPHLLQRAVHFCFSTGFCFASAVGQGLDPFLNVNIERFAFGYNGVTNMLVDRYDYEFDFLGDTDPNGQEIATYEDLVARLQAALENYIAATDSIPRKPWSTDNNHHDWIHLSPAGGTGNGSVTITVAKNMQNTPREAKIFIAGQETTLKQAGFTDCSYEISPHQAVFSPGGETISFDVTTTSPECPWRISRPDTLKDWLFVTPGSGTGDGKVTLTVTPNPGELKKGTITIAEQTFDITQGSDASCFYNPILSRQSFTAMPIHLPRQSMMIPKVSLSGSNSWKTVRPGGR
jgi:hypothetical protein